MLISHSHKFIFIHVYKVAGTSIKYTMGLDACYDRKHNSFWDNLKMKLGIWPNIYSVDFEPHISAKELSENLPANLFQQYYKFSFVRNPYQWLTSLYEYILENTSHYLHQETVAKESFAAFAKWMAKHETHHHSQSKLLTDEQGKLMVDFLGKYESLQTDLDAVCKQVGLPPRPIQYQNKTKREKKANYYDAELADFVYQAYEQDFILFGYPKELPL
jgi:hypothetical protein